MNGQRTTIGYYKYSFAIIDNYLNNLAKYACAKYLAYFPRVFPDSFQTLPIYLSSVNSHKRANDIAKCFV